MENKLTNVEKIRLATNSQFTSEEIAIIKSTVAKNTTDIELTYFMSLAKTLNLNPFNKEIWCYKSGSSLMAFAGRDGFLKIAQSNRLWNGITSSEVRENDVFEVDIPKGEITHKPNFKNKGKILLAYCYIKPKGCDTATIEIADFDTYNKNANVWKSHPADMIKKVAEIKALKKAFGIAGLYDENDFTEHNGNVTPIYTEGDPLISQSQFAHIESLIKTSVFDDDERVSLGLELTALTESKVQDFIANLLQNQQDPITQQGRYSQTDIKNKLDEISS